MPENFYWRIIDAFLVTLPIQPSADRIVSTLSYIITSAVTIGVIFSATNFKIKRGEN
jgi:hypothetical protein